MAIEGKVPLDNRTDAGRDARARRFAEIERREGETPGVKEMAMTRRARDEDAGARAAKFIDIERKGD